MKVRVKKLSEKAVIPQYAKDGDAGLDLVAISYEYEEQGNFVYGTGLSIEIPEGYVGLIYPRSSISKTHLALTNSVGVIDSGYRGEIMFKFSTSMNFYLDEVDLPRVYDDDNLEVNEGDLLNIYKIGDKIGQLIIVPYPKIELEEADELSTSERGTGGYGSTGN